MTLEATLVPTIVEQVNPVVLPLFATAPLYGAAMAWAGVRPVPDVGGPGFGTPFVSVVPRSRMLPLVSTAPLTTCARAASIFGIDPVSRGKYSERFATVCVELLAHFTSINPGCVMPTPTSGLPEFPALFASTWLLLRMYCVPLRVTKAPSVPEQQ